MSLEIPVRERAPFAEAPGVTPPSTPAGRPGFLTDVIVEMGFAPRELVDQAVEQSRLAGKQAASILVENETITEAQVAHATAERNGLFYVDLSVFDVDQGAMRLIGSDTATRYRAAPVAFDGDGALIVALADPLDALAVADIGVITKSEVRPAVATDSGIDSLLATMPQPPPRRLTQEPEDFEAESASDGPAERELSQSISSAEPEEAVVVAEPEPEPEPIVELEPLVSPEPEPEPIVDLEPEPEPEPIVELESEPAPEPPAPVDVPVAATGIPGLEDAPAALQNRIVDLVAAALDDFAESEVERLEAELADERRAREELERERDQERAAHELMTTALEDANEKISGLGSRLEKLDRKSSEHKQERDEYKAERDDLRETAAEARAAQERERDRRTEAETRVREGVARAAESSGGLEHSLEQLTAAIAGARAASEEVAAIHRQLGEDLGSGE